MTEEQGLLKTKHGLNRQLLSRILGVLAMLMLGGSAVALAYVFGKQINEDQWPLLITATGLAVFLVVVVNNPRHGLILWVAVAPFARFIHLNIELGRGIPNLTLNRIMTGVLSVLLLAQLAIGRRKMVRINLLDVMLVLFCGAAALSVPQSTTPLRSAVQSFFDLIIIPAAVYFFARNLITTTRQLKTVMYMLVIVGLYLSVIAIHEQLTGVVWFYPEDRSIEYTASIRRVVGLLGNPAYIAVCIAMALPWAWYLLLTARRRRLLLLLVVATMCAGVYFCMNRSAWVGLLAGLLVMALFVRRFRGIFLMLLLVGAIVAGVYWAIIISSTTIQERLTAKGPIEYRLQTWDVSLRMIQDYPIFGLGYENFASFYSRYGYWDVYLRATPSPHNTYLWVILMGGVVAAAPFVIMLLYMALAPLGLYYRALPHRREMPYADLTGVFLASMTAIWVPALAMDILTGYYNTMVMFMIMGAYFGVVSWEGWYAKVMAGVSWGADKALSRRLVEGTPAG